MKLDETSGGPEAQGAADTAARRATVDRDFHRNHDPADFIRYADHWVAWSLDGRRVLFASPDPYQLCAAIDAAGLTSDEYIFGRIAPLDAPTEIGGIVSIDDA